MTVGGDRLQYPDNTASPAATLLETILLLNNTISQSVQATRFMTLNMKDFFQQIGMEHTEFMKIILTFQYFLKGIRDKYNIKSKIHVDRSVNCKIK